MPFTNDLQGFCYYLVHKYGNPGALSEEQKADEFRKMYVMGSPVKMKDIRAVAVCCNIKVDTLEGMPPNLRGYHDVYDENSTIYYKQGDAVSGIENTILHEIREMMEPHFMEVCPSYEPLDNGTRHIAANKFASAVLLPRESFTNKVCETGLDVIELAGYYAKSYSQVLLRIGEVLNGKCFFYGALCEREPERNIWLLNYCTLSPSLFPEPDISELGAFFPTKGATVTPGSLVDMAIRERKPCLARVITLLDGPPRKGKTREGLVAMVRPLLTSGVPTRVVLLVVLGRNKNLLEPQIKRIAPEIVKDFQSSLY
jgi:hypothetical protein